MKDFGLKSLNGRLRIAEIDFIDRYGSALDRGLHEHPSNFDKQKAKPYEGFAFFLPTLND